MSTKIYDGFVISPSITGLEGLNKELIKFRKELIPIINDGYWDYLAVMAHNFIDNKAFGIIDETDEKIAFWYAEHRLCKAIKVIEERQIRDPFVDYDCSLVLFPHKNRIYGIIYTEQKKIRELWSNKKFVKGYGYWNNTDPEDNVTDKEWKERGEIWDKILSDDNGLHGIPSMNGYTVECTGKFYTYDIQNLDEIIKRIPSFNHRVNRIAQNLVFDRFKTQEKKNGIEFVSWSKFLAFLKKDGKKEFQEVKLDIKKKLLPYKKITKNMLLQEFK